MTPHQRRLTLGSAIDRAHSVRSPGHWDATTSALIAGWRAADKKVTEALTLDALFLAAVSRENCAMVLRAREMGGPWNA